MTVVRKSVILIRLRVRFYVRFPRNYPIPSHIMFDAERETAGTLLEHIKVELARAIWKY